MGTLSDTFADLILQFLFKTYATYIFTTRSLTVESLKWSISKYPLLVTDSDVPLFLKR